MKINRVTKEVRTVMTYYITLKDGRDVVYIEYLDGDMVEDFVLRDEEGNDMGDEAAGIVDELEEAVNEYNK